MWGSWLTYSQTQCLASPLVKPGPSDVRAVIQLLAADGQSWGPPGAQAGPLRLDHMEVNVAAGEDWGCRTWTRCL